MSAAVASTVMPHPSRHAAGLFRVAVAIAAALVLGLSALGYIPAALLAAAVAVPVTYLLYLFEVNVWEDSPIEAVLLAFVLTGALGAIVSWIIYRGPFHDWFTQLSVTSARSPIGDTPIGPLLFFAVLVPILISVLVTVGPILLVRIRDLDEMIDGFTFGVAAGTAYAGAETIVAYWPTIVGDSRVTSGASSWVPLVLNIMVVRSLMYGTAAGIVLAAFTGPGEGDAGFGRKYKSATLLAAAALVAYRLGAEVLAHVSGGEYLTLAWGAAVLAVLTVKARIDLHTALLEAAVEDALGGRAHGSAAAEGGLCPQCGMPTMAGALFCLSCGQSVRAHPAADRRSLQHGAKEHGDAGVVS